MASRHRPQASAPLNMGLSGVKPPSLRSMTEPSHKKTAVYLFDDSSQPCFISLHKSLVGDELTVTSATEEGREAASRTSMRPCSRTSSSMRPSDSAIAVPPSSHTNCAAVSPITQFRRKIFFRSNEIFEETA